MPDLPWLENLKCLFDSQKMFVGSVEGKNPNFSYPILKKIKVGKISEDLVLAVVAVVQWGNILS